MGFRGCRKTEQDIQLVVVLAFRWPQLRVLKIYEQASRHLKLFEYIKTQFLVIVFG